YRSGRLRRNIADLKLCRTRSGSGLDFRRIVDLIGFQGYTLWHRLHRQGGVLDALFGAGLLVSRPAGVLRRFLLCIRTLLGVSLLIVVSLAFTVALWSLFARRLVSRRRLLLLAARQHVFQGLRK